MFRKKLIGIFLIILGFFWTLENFNLIQWDIIDALFEFWPVILVFLGIDMILKSK